MTKILINYANNMYYSSQKNNTKTGLEIGGFDKCVEFGYNDIDDDFKSENINILSQNKGAGYWLWKPYIILKTLEKMDINDILFYCDSGCSFIGNLNDYLFEKCYNDEKGIILFNGSHLNKYYIKRDCFYYMNCDTKEFIDANHLTASFNLVRKTDFSIKFYREFLNFSKDYRILTDSPNECGFNNYDGFRDHRHDQSILSLLAIKYKISLVEDISQFGNTVREKGYKQLINHHRNKN
jgi:hypothetical protein